MDANRPGSAAGGYFGGLGGGSITSRAIQPLLDSDPRQVGPYAIRGRLGQGAMGHVYLAFAPTGPAFALKVLRPDFASDSDFRRRFAREISAARAVHSPFVNAVTDADPDAPTPWLASYFIPGPPLNSAVNLSGPFSPRSVAHLGVGIGLALQAIHTAGVVHRDLKPGNVLIASDGPRVIDFGIARAADASMLTSTGMRLGTPSFMAPEQVSGSNVGAAVDVWAIGGMLVYAATGRTPFGDGNAMAILYRVENHEPDLEGMEPALAEIAERCLAKDPKDRPSPAKLVELCRAALYGGMDGFPVLPGVDSTGWLPAAISRDLASRAVELAAVRQTQVGIPVSGPQAGGPIPQQAQGPAPTGKAGKGPRLSRKEKAQLAQAQAAAMMAPGARPPAGPPQGQMPPGYAPQPPQGAQQQGGPQHGGPQQGYGPQGQMPPQGYGPPQGQPPIQGQMLPPPVTHQMPSQGAPSGQPGPQGQQGQPGGQSANGAGWLQAQPQVAGQSGPAPWNASPQGGAAPGKPTTSDSSASDATQIVPVMGRAAVQEGGPGGSAAGPDTSEDVDAGSGQRDGAGEKSGFDAFGNSPSSGSANSPSGIDPFSKPPAGDSAAVDTGTSTDVDEADEEPEPIAPWLAVQGVRTPQQRSDGLSPIPTPSQETSNGPAPRAPWDPEPDESDAAVDDDDDSEMPSFSTLGPGLLQARPTSAKSITGTVLETDGAEPDAVEPDEDNERADDLVESSFPASPFRGVETSEDAKDPKDADDTDDDVAPVVIPVLATPLDAEPKTDARPESDDSESDDSDSDSDSDTDSGAEAASASKHDDDRDSDEDQDGPAGSHDETVHTPLSPFAAQNLADQPTIFTPMRPPQPPVQGPGPGQGSGPSGQGSYQQPQQQWGPPPQGQGQGQGHGQAHGQPWGSAPPAPPQMPPAYQPGNQRPGQPSQPSQPNQQPGQPNQHGPQQSRQSGPGTPNQQGPAQLPNYNRAYGGPPPPAPRDEDEGFNPLPAKRMAILAAILVVAIGGAGAIGVAVSKDPKTTPSGQSSTQTSNHPSGGTTSDTGSSTPSAPPASASAPTSAVTSIPANQLPGRAAGQPGARDVVINGLFVAAANHDYNMICSVQTPSALQDAAVSAGWTKTGDAAPFCRKFYEQAWGSLDSAYLRARKVTKVVPGRDANHVTVYVNDPSSDGKLANRFFDVQWNGTRWILGK